MLAIIDYGMGNLRSVSKALEAAGASKVRIVSEAKEILKADKIVLPGVGAMAEAISALRKLNLIEPIKESIFRKPFLGICLGLQLLFTESEEGGRVRGLGIFKGKVRRFSGRLKVPHMGWNQIKRNTRDARRGAAMWKGIPDNSYFYFCHSYYVVPEDKSIIVSNTDYGKEFVSSISRDNLFACQFHPEKSQAAGLMLLKNFVRQ
jgi:imidazole glycerol-phosphate synthase subunit HisH